jgi:hypothetical protein
MPIAIVEECVVLRKSKAGHISTPCRSVDAVIRTELRKAGRAAALIVVSGLDSFLPLWVPFTSPSGWQITSIDIAYEFEPPNHGRREKIAPIRWYWRAPCLASLRS